MCTPCGRSDIAPQEMVSRAAANPYTLHTMLHINASHANMISGAAVIPYTLWTMTHITVAHVDKVSEAVGIHYTF